MSTFASSSSPVGLSTCALAGLAASVVAALVALGSQRPLPAGAELQR